MSEFDLTMDELRVVARYVAESAEAVLPVFDKAHPGDPRPRAALSAADRPRRRAEPPRLAAWACLGPAGIRSPRLLLVATPIRRP